MAEVILGSVADSIAGKLVSLASQEIGQACGVKDELDKLKRTARAITAVLSDAEKRQVHEADVKHWLTELREAVYDVDDLLDDFSTEALRRRVMGGNRILKEVRFFFSSSNRLFYRFKMAHQVKAIRRKLDAIADDRSKYNFTEAAHQVVVGGKAARKIRDGDVYTFVRESDVIGRDIDKQNIINFLLEEQPLQNVSVLAIVGIGGLGKTALAKLVFNDRTSVHEHFQVKLWICVSDSFDLKTILMKLLGNSSDGRQLVMDELIMQLRGEIARKRFLLVLDDVWNENRDKWLELETLLRDGANGSKILVTTRNHSVVRAMGAKSYPLQGLSENEALSLLMQMASKQEREWKNGMLEAIGKEIVQKCRHVPLAIRTIGRMLARTENTEADWIDFKTRELSKIDDQEDTDILPTLKLSYDSLPSHLKQCFTYCSLFPKDDELEADDLIHLWIAQGFVPSFDNTETPEDAGHRCFKELVWRSFFQDFVEDDYGNIMRCKMHDLMHDLAKKVVGNDCVIISNASRDFIHEESRHIYVDDEVDFEQNKVEGHSKVRSLLCDNHWEEADPYHLLKTITSHFRNLRALRLRLKIVPDSIGKLKHLRFLDLSWNIELVALPNSIGDLLNLEALNLYSLELRELPRGITKLIKLRNLNIGASSLTHMPKGISQLKSLKVLSDFVVGEEGNLNAAGLEELSKLQGLKGDLTIDGLWRLDNVSRKWDDSVSLLQNLKLRSVRFSYWHDYRDVSEEIQSNQEAVLERLRPHSDLKGLMVNKYRGRTFPAWLASQLHQLVKLKIMACNYCKRLPPVHQLPSLKVFNLEDLVELEFIEDEGSSGHSPAFFPSLEQLTLLDLPKFKGWERTAIGKSQVNSVQEEQQHDDLLIPVLPERIVCSIRGCPRFSYMRGQHLSLWNVTEKVVQRLERTSIGRAPSKEEVVEMVSFMSVYSVSLNGLKSLYMENTRGIQVLQEDFYQCLSSLQRLAIRNWPDLKNLSGRVILKHLPALTYLEISSCPQLDLSSDEEEDDVQLLQKDPVSNRLCEVRLRGFENMERLPGWIRHLSELEKLYIGDCSNLKVLGEEVICSLGSLKELEITSCHGLKSLSRRLILHLLTTLESLTIEECGDLDLYAAESDEEDNEANLQSCGRTTLRKLTISNISNLVVVPWWIECLSNLEYLEFDSCPNMKELPEWFPKLTSLGELWITYCGELSRRCRGGEDWPKISHISPMKCIVL